MSDTSVPTPPEESVASASSKRPWTILGRLSKAIREQNWFAVALELVIVVLGVVIGFQVTAWGQARSDRAKEQTYLRQLAEDLRESERLVVQTDSAFAGSRRATILLIRAFYEPVPPPSDSLRRWLTLSGFARTVRPVMGTTTALVTTGDMNLIRNDSLRTTITAYADAMERIDGVQQAVVEWWTEAMLVVEAQMDAADTTEEIQLVWGHVPDSVLAQIVPQEERRRPFPFDPAAFLSSREANGAVFQMFVRVNHMEDYRRQIAERSSALREQVEAELNR